MEIYENKGDNSTILDFRGVTHPVNDEQVVPTIQEVLDNTTTMLRSKMNSGMRLVDLEETIGFLEMVRSLTVPKAGFPSSETNYFL